MVDLVEGKKREKSSFEIERSNAEPEKEKNQRSRAPKRGRKETLKGFLSLKTRLR